MSFGEMMAALALLGIEAKTDGERLRLRPRSVVLAMPTELRAAIRKHRRRLIERLMAPPKTLSAAQTYWFEP